MPLLSATFLARPDLQAEEPALRALAPAPLSKGWGPPCIIYSAMPTWNLVTHFGMLCPSGFFTDEQLFRAVSAQEYFSCHQVKGCTNSLTVKDIIVADRPELLFSGIFSVYICHTFLEHNYAAHACFSIGSFQSLYTMGRGRHFWYSRLEQKKPFALLALLHFTIRLQVTFLSQFREWFVCFNICIEV